MTRLSSQELQATLNSEAKNIASVTFFKTAWHVEASGHLDYFRPAVQMHFMVIMIFFMFENWSPYTLIVWEVTATPFSCEIPAVFGD